MPKFEEFIIEAGQPDFMVDPKFKEKMKDLRKPEKDALLSFKTVGGEEWRLALIAESWIGKMEPKWMYASKDKKKCAMGTYSGGITGSGISDYQYPIDGKKYFFVQFYK